MTAIEGPQRQSRYIYAIETAHVDVDLVRIGAGHVEGMNSADLAERVPGDFGVELVGGKIFLAAEKFEPFRRHNQVQKTFLPAHRAVAFGDTVKIGGYAEPHAAAVAAALIH
jgi:hypothetical protein